MDGSGQWILKLVSVVCLLLALADYWDLTHRMEAAMRRAADRLWKIYPRYWHLIYHAKREEMTGAPRFLADLGHTTFFAVLAVGILFGGFLFGERNEDIFAAWKLVVLGAAILFVSPLVFSGAVWLLHLLSLPRKGIVMTASLLLSLASFSVDMIR